MTPTGTITELAAHLGVNRKVLALRITRSTIKPVAGVWPPRYRLEDVTNLQRAYALPVSARRFLRGA